MTGPQAPLSPEEAALLHDNIMIRQIAVRGPAHSPERAYQHDTGASTNDDKICEGKVAKKSTAQAYQIHARARLQPPLLGGMNQDVQDVILV